MSYLDYAWARAQRSGWSGSDLDKRLQATTSHDPPFYGVIMLAMMRADSRNAAMLRRCWPDVWDECQARYDAPGALLDSDGDGLRAQVLAS
jgi:hypothetical protein